jgi:seryl-tRNA synthetase
MLRIPNLPHADAPNGAGDHENPVVKGPINMPAQFADHQRVPHWETASHLGILDNERATKIAGAMFTMQRGLGATLARALCQFALDSNADAFEEIRPPSFVTTATLTATGHLPKFADDAYAIERDDLWAIPTAEVPVTNVYSNEIIKDSDLPIKMTAYTPCFRREAGSFGSDVRGLNRVHQFDKVEVIQIVKPQDSYAVLESMVLHVEKLLNLLELPYRILRLCGGDMGFTSALTYDFEVYSAAQQKWLEVSSVSNFETFQTNRMKIRYKDDQGKTQLLHSLNGSSLALPRIVASLLENNQTKDGIQLPQILHKYFGASSIN